MFNLGASTSKLNVGVSGSGNTTSGNDNKQQYIPSRIFSQDKTNEEKNMNLGSSPPHISTGGTTNMQSPGGVMMTPNTQYTSYYSRSMGPYQSSPSSQQQHHVEYVNSNTPNLNRRFGIGSSHSNINNAASSSSGGGSGNIGGANNNQDLTGIPTSSIYEEPKQLKQQIQQQHQQQQIFQQNQTNATIKQHQFNQSTLFTQVEQQHQLQLQQQQQQQIQQQQQMQQKYTPPTLNHALSANDLLGQGYQQQQSLYPQTPITNQQLSPYNNTNSPFLNIQLQQQQMQQQTPSPVPNALETPTNRPFIQSAPLQQQQNSQILSDKYDRRWVTVFGFTQDKTDLIVDELLKYGKIIKIEYPQQSNSNWVYFQFESEFVAMDLLKKNGLVIGNCMIGILPCKDKIKSETDPIKSQQLQPNNSYLSIEQKYHPARPDYDPQSFSNGDIFNTPSRPSFFSKVSEYVFGSG